MAETVVVMTVISLALVIEVLTQFQNKVDPNIRRLGLLKYKEKQTKNRRVERSGMGNDEIEYYNEYDSEQYGSELADKRKHVKMVEEVSEYDDESAKSQLDATNQRIFKPSEPDEP
jgi:hypothetical protein